MYVGIRFNIFSMEIDHNIESLKNLKHIQQKGITNIEALLNVYG